MVNSDASPCLLNGFGGRIGGDELAALLSKTLVTLEQDYAFLNTLLLDYSWDLAADKAHQLKGSAYLFECEGILYFLEQISEKNISTIAAPTFKEDFRLQLDVCLNQLRQALDAAVTRN